MKIIFCLILLFISNLACGFQGKVISIIDGDTIIVIDSNNIQKIIRLAEIDAPEKDQPWGKKSKTALSNLIYRKTIEIDENSSDEYGRTIATIILDGTNINYQQIKTGNAWAYRKYVRSQYPIDLEYQARENNRGLWSIPSPVKPSLWRKRKKSH